MYQPLNMMVYAANKAKNLEKDTLEKIDKRLDNMEEELEARISAATGALLQRIESLESRVRELEADNGCWRDINNLANAIWTLEDLLNHHESILWNSGLKKNYNPANLGNILDKG